SERCALNLVRAIHSANQDLYARNVYKKITAPSSSTVVAVIFDEERVQIWHVGDSRFYCCRDGKLTQVTSDHTIVRKLLDAGVRITPEIQKQYGHIISRAIGPGNNGEVEVNELERRPGDRYMLCSDGLSNMVKFERIQEIMTRVQSARECNCELMRQALIGGGTDNVTVISIFS
ncbi:MAG: protein phosphatase 2C domain-containing protein, partial [Victivallaceae bacterium]